MDGNGIGRRARLWGGTLFMKPVDSYAMMRRSRYRQGNSWCAVLDRIADNEGKLGMKISDAFDASSWRGLPDNFHYRDSVNDRFRALKQLSHRLRIPF